MLKLFQTFLVVMFSPENWFLFMLFIFQNENKNSNKWIEQ
jgi:hypothetical protein